MYCGVPGSPCLGKTGPVWSVFLNFKQSLGKPCLGILRTHCALHKCLVKLHRLEAPRRCQVQSTSCLITARSRGGSSETPPRWHVTVLSRVWEVVSPAKTSDA